jgi:hypothetical protein
MPRLFLFVKISRNLTVFRVIWFLVITVLEIFYGVRVFFSSQRKRKTTAQKAPEADSGDAGWVDG